LFFRGRGQWPSEHDGLVPAGPVLNECGDVGPATVTQLTATADRSVRLGVYPRRPPPLVKFEDSPSPQRPLPPLRPLPRPCRRPTATRCPWQACPPAPAG